MKSLYLIIILIISFSIAKADWEKAGSGLPNTWNHVDYAIENNILISALHVAKIYISKDNGKNWEY
jgi:hypothetical protein